MKSLTLEQAAKMAGGTHRGSGVITHVTNNSQTAAAGSLFVALPGEKTDGHRFVQDVLAKGGYAMVKPGSTEQPGVIEVIDPLQGLQDLARTYLTEFDIPVIAVTGSNGKTTTKDMISRILAERYNVHHSEGNYNNELGLPLTILGLDDHHEAMVVEMGMRGLGQIDLLTKICPPDVAVITNIGPVHLEILGSLENIARAKSEILAGLKTGGLAVLNGDDPLIRELAERVDCETVFFGKELSSDLVVSQLTTDDHGRAAFRVDGLGVSGHVSLSVPGLHNVENAAAAIIVGLRMGVPFDDCVRALQNVRITGMRLETVETITGVRILNDVYNASPASMRGALDTLASTNCSGRRIAILGDMLELGSISEKAHLEVGAYAARCADQLYFVGNWADALQRGAGAGNVFPSVEELLENLPNAEKGDLVLVKASRGLRLERVVERLREGV